MGIKERRERERQYVRSMIMKVVNQIVSNEGWSGVTIRKIADEIEYSPPIIYEHFDSKESILLELTREAFSKLLKQYDKVIKEASSPKEVLHEFLKVHYDFCMQHKGYAKSMLGLDGVPSAFYLKVEEWDQVVALFKKYMMETVGYTDENDERLQDCCLQYRWIARGATTAAIVRLQDEDKEPPFNDHQKVKQILCDGVDALIEGARRKLTV